MNTTKKQIAKFIFLPGIVPRIKELTLDLHWFAYLMALIFAATKILPANHPYVTSRKSDASHKNFGIQDVLFEAGRHLKGGARHIDQYIVYGSFVLAVILLVGQFVILLFILATHTAEAANSLQVPSFKGMFVTRAPENDLALMMLDKVFAIPNLFQSKFDPAIAGTNPFNSSLHAIFAFYNEGMLFIAGLIFLYYLFAVTIETLQTGTPFGQRFQEVYVPLRLILALAFLVPLGYGFSAGQMLVLKLAQWGSGFATNSWIIFNQRAQLNPLGEDAMALSVLPKTEDIASLLRFYSLAHSCRAIYQLEYGKEIKPYIIYKSGTNMVSVEANSLDYDTALDSFEKGPITVTFGQKDSSFKNFNGQVKSYCGSMTLPTDSSQIDGAKLIHATYWSFMQQLWTDDNLIAYGNRMAKNFTQKTDAPASSITVDGWPDPNNNPEVGFYANVRTDLQARFESAMQDAKDQLRNSDDAKMQIDKDIMDRGWGGAGIWFNKIAAYNGAIVSANHSIPVPSSYPTAMVQIADKKRESQNGIGTLTQFITTFNGRTLADAISGAGLDTPATDGKIATFLGNIYNDMTSDNVYGDGSETHDDNVVANTFNAIFGTEGLNDLRGNDQIHPLAKMSALGKSIIDRAITYIGGAMVMGGLSGLASVLDHIPQIQGIGSGLSQAFSGIGGMFLNFAFIGVVVGIVLYYVIPFLPFLYFFFAVARWVKSIFEAVVGVPLWALAHMRIDGEGVPGEAATQGYLLLLEILLRPILVVFGLMAAVSCFSALAIALDTIFDLVITNVTGYNPVDSSGAYSFKGIEFKRSNIDQFFYTVVYAVLLYLMATSCFKLIDLIPAGVLRFIGTGVASFNDEMNLEQNIVRYTALSAYSMTREAGQAAMEAGTIVGQGAAFPVNFGAEVMQNMRSIQEAGAEAASARNAATETPPAAETPPQAKPAEAPPSSEPAAEPEQAAAPPEAETPAPQRPAPNSGNAQLPAKAPEGTDKPDPEGTPPK